jgi:hypothetical protein
VTVSRTPKNKTQEDNQEQMFEPPFAMQFEDDEKKVDEPDERDEKINSLSTQLAEMQRRLEETARTNVAMISHTESEVFQPEREIQVPDLNEDTAGHIQAVTQNALIKDRNERRRADWERKQNESIDDKVKALWDDFGTRHPELAAVPQERIEYAATEVAKKS